MKNKSVKLTKPVLYLNKDTNELEDGYLLFGDKTDGALIYLPQPIPRDAYECSCIVFATSYRRDGKTKKNIYQDMFRACFVNLTQKESNFIEKNFKIKP